jgi:hypothetical protein
MGEGKCMTSCRSALVSTFKRCRCACTCNEGGGLCWHLLEIELGLNLSLFYFLDVYNKVYEAFGVDAAKLQVRTGCAVRAREQQERVGQGICAIKWTRRSGRCLKAAGVRKGGRRGGLNPNP